MIFLKSKKAEALGALSFRKITDDKKTKVIAVVGTVADLKKIGLLEYCSLPGERWCCIPAGEISYIDDRGSDCAGFGFSREDAIDRVNYGLGIC